jgi:ribose transport system substrate-binding protein
MNSLKRIAAFVLAIGLFLGGASFAQQATVGLSLSTLNNPFFVSVRDGAQQEASLYDGFEVVVTDAQNDLNNQVSDVQDLIAQGVDVLLINPVDSAGIVPAVREANRAGIPVFAIDRAIDVSGDANVVAQIASDNVFGGRLQARFVAEAIGNEGNVVYLAGIPGTSAARDREAGFTDELAQLAPDVEIIANQPAGFDRGEGLTVMQNILQANQGQIDAVVAANDSMALGAMQAIQQAGETRPDGGQIVIVGFDAIDSALDAIENGNMAATIAQQPALMGQLGVSAARQVVLNGLMFDTLDNGQFMPVEVQVIDGSGM